MTEQEYLLARLCALEHAVRSVMATVMEMMPPTLADNISRIGWQWDKELDELRAAQAATRPTEEE